VFVIMLWELGWRGNCFLVLEWEGWGEKVGKGRVGVFCVEGILS